MSDRLAVFHNGRIEQVGAPAAIYETPQTEFVAGFVGISNVLKGDAAREITGEAGPIAVRPEKIRMTLLDAGVTDSSRASGASLSSTAGRVREVVYLGMSTRYLVDLDRGGTLTVVEQNLRMTSMQVLETRGQEVRLSWDAAHNHRLSPTGSDPVQGPTPASGPALGPAPGPGPAPRPEAGETR